jgi:hypothetical protein
VITVDGYDARVSVRKKKEAKEEEHEEEEEAKRDRVCVSCELSHVSANLEPTAHPSTVYC